MGREEGENIVVVTLVLNRIITSLSQLEVYTVIMDNRKNICETPAVTSL